MVLFQKGDFCPYVGEITVFSRTFTLEALGPSFRLKSYLLTTRTVNYMQGPTASLKDTRKEPPQRGLFLGEIRNWVGPSPSPPSTLNQRGP